MKVYRIVDVDGKFGKTYRHIGHVRQAMNFLPSCWLKLPLRVVTYELTEVDSVRIEDFA